MNGMNPRIFGRIPSTKARVRRLGIALLLIVATASCGADDDDRPAEVSPYRISNELTDMTAVWSAEPDVDIFSEHGTLMRAAVESEFIDNLGAEFESGYYGYDKALIGREGLYTPAQLRDRSGGLPSGPVHMKLLSLTPSPNGFEGVACTTIGGLADQVNSGKYAVWRVGAVVSTHVEFAVDNSFDKSSVPVVRGSRAPLPNSSNPQWQSPAGFLFGGWHIKVRNSVPEELNRCRLWGYELYPPRLDGLEDGTLHGMLISQRPPPLPAYPGWPE